MTRSLTNKQKILKNFLSICLLNGWNDKSLSEAVIQSGFNREERGDFFDGVDGLTNFYIEEGNDQLRVKSTGVGFESMKVRDKIKELVKMRLLLEIDNVDALKVLTSVSRGRKISNLLKNTYKVSDLIWELAGDKSEDFNFYTKRLILSKVFIRTFIYFINDNSSDNRSSWNFLDSQIEKVMMVAKVKGKVKGSVLKVHEFIEKTCDLTEGFKKLPFIRLINSRN